MEDFLASSYFSVFGAMLGCVILRLTKTVDYSYLLVFLLIDVFAFSLISPLLISGSWTRNSVLAIVALSGLCIIVSYFGDRKDYKLTSGKSEERWGRYLFGIALICFSTAYGLNIDKLMLALPAEWFRPFVINFALLLFSVLCIGVIGIAIFASDRSKRRHRFFLITGRRACRRVSRVLAFARNKTRSG